jgi:hypothetical protein
MFGMTGWMFCRGSQARPRQMAGAHDGAFSAAGAAMRQDVGGVDGDLFRRSGQGLRQGREQVLNQIKVSEF